MLSYRHAFHAGNFADVLKHVVLVEILLALRRKDKPFVYIDTHAGAGRYDLKSADAQKLEEFAGGIGRLVPAQWPELADYFDAISALNPPGVLQYYPGSPLIALHLMRAQDKAWLYELHPRDFERLNKNSDGGRRVHILNEDGFGGLLSLLPPASRRGLVLIDPPYEVKSDYERVFTTVEKAHRKFATGIYAIWYPVVERQHIVQLEKRLLRSGIRDIQRFELGLSPDTDERGMTASGMIVINPPWGLYDRMSALLPRLRDTLGKQGSAFCKAEVLVEE